MGLKAAWHWMMLGRTLDRVKKALTRGADMNGNGVVDGYDGWITVRKGIRALLGGALSLCLPVLVAYLSDPVAVGAALSQAGYSPALIAVVAPLILALGAMGRNWIKQGGK